MVLATGTQFESPKSIRGKGAWAGGNEGGGGDWGLSSKTWKPSFLTNLKSTQQSDPKQNPYV